MRTVEKLLYQIKYRAVSQRLADKVRLRVLVLAGLPWHDFVNCVRKTQAGA